MGRRFYKYHGLGNDFVVLSRDDWAEGEVNGELAKVLCDRHRGVGGDGVIWVGDGGAERLRMVIYNADGSRPEMCGNGVRCVVAWWADEGKLREGERVLVKTDAGEKRAVLLEGRRAGERWVEVEMGRARVGERERVKSAGGVREVYVVDMGNPHGVVFGGECDDEMIDAVRRLSVFAAGVNVEWVTEREGGGWRVKVNERGVGWTQACGTGACAVVAAAVSREKAVAGDEVTVELDGGELKVTVEKGGGVVMRGPAQKVFAGEL